jgi:hypothetical protein
LSVSSILHGRGSAADASVIDTFQRTGELRFSQYIEARYPIFRRENTQLEAFVGGAIALAGQGETFYTTRNGINFIGLQYRTVVQIGNIRLPVQATPACNPNAKHAFMEVAINFF